MKKKLLLLMSMIGLGLTSLLDASHPSLSRLHGQRYVGGVTQDVTVGAAGQLDGSFRSLGTGKLLVNHVSGVESFASVALQSDGKIVAAGARHNGTANKVKVARFFANGLFDTSFNRVGYVHETDLDATGADVVTAVAVQADGKILVAGYYAASGPVSADRGFVIRYDSDGSRDAAFGTGGLVTLSLGEVDTFYERVTDMVVQPDGQIVIVANRENNADMVIARLSSSNGSLDSTFNTTGIQTLQIAALATAVQAVTVQPDGKLVVSGQHNSADFFVARFNADGSLDTDGFVSPNGYATTSIGTTDVANSVLVDNQGKILVAGQSDNDFAVVCYQQNGTVDGSFGTAGIATFDIGTATVDTASDIVLQSDGQMIVAGSSDNDFAVIRIDAIGNLDTNFGTSGKVTTDVNGGTDQASAIAVQSDKKIVVVGAAGNDAALVRYDSFGKLDTSLLPHGALDLSSELILSKVVAMSVQSDGKIVAVLESATQFKVVRYLTSGLADAGFSHTAVNATDVNGVLVAASGKIYVCGGDDTTDSNGWIYEVAADGSSSTAFTADTDVRSVNALAQLSDGKIVAAVTLDTTGKAGLYVYTNASTLHTGFDTDGKLAFADGGAAITSGAYDVVVDSSDNIYTVYNRTNLVVHKVDNAGATDGSWNAEGASLHADLNGATASSTRLALSYKATLTNVVVVTAENGTDIKSSLIAQSNGAAFGSAGTVSQNSEQLRNAKLEFVLDETGSATTESDYKGFVFGHNEATGQHFVARLSYDGSIDSSFGQNGIVYIPILGERSNSQVHAGAIGEDGRLYVGGFETQSATDYPFISRVFHEEKYKHVARFPQAITAGSLITSFGGADGVAGVLQPFTGLYGSALRLSSRSIIELASGKFLIGMDGKTNTDADRYLHLVRLNADGSFDTSFNSDGKLILSQTSGVSNEWIAHMLEDKDGNILIVSHADDGGGKAILHKLDSSGSPVGGNWPVIISGSNYRGLRVGIQSSQRILFSAKVGSSEGRLFAYGANGSPDVTFNPNGTNAGQIASGEFGLTNMGHVYATIVDPDDDVVIAYRNSSTGGLDLARITSEGRGLAQGFGTSGKVSSLISNVVSGDQIKVAVDKDDNIVVAVVDTNGDYKVAAVDRDTGSQIGSTLTINTNITSAKIFDLVTVDDGSILLAGYDNDTSDDMIIIRMTSGPLALDTTFNAAGAAPGIKSFKFNSNYATRRVAGVAVSSSTGNIVFAAHEDDASTHSVPVIASILGTSGTAAVRQLPNEVASPGIVDNTFDDDGVMDLSVLSGLTTGTAKLVYAYRGSQTHAAKMLVAIEESGTAKLARLHADETLDSSFGTAGLLDLSAQGITTLILDADEKIVVAGHNQGSGWMKRYTADGVLDKTFDVPAGLIEIYAAGEQTAGRYLVAGATSGGKGVVVAFRDRDASNIPVDTTYNPLGSTAGHYEFTNAAALYGLAVNSDDSAYVAYAHSSTGNVHIQKLLENGTLDTGFGDIDTAVVAADASSVKILTDGSAYVVAFEKATDTVHVRNASNNFDISGLGTGITLTHAMLDANSKPIVMGYNGSGGNGRLWVSRAVAACTGLDTTFNASPSGADVAGLITFDANGSDELHHGSIYLNGRIVYAGREATGNTPVVGRLYGDNYVVETEQHPTESSTGTFDTTLGASGIFAFDNSVSASATAKIVHVYADGKMLVGFNVGTSTRIAQFKADRTLDATFGSSGYTDIANFSTLNDMFVADDATDNGDIYLVGAHSGAMVAKRLNSAGTVDGTFTISNAQNMTFGNKIRKHSFGRVVISGFDGTNGCVAAFNTSGGVDSMFASGNGKKTFNTNQIGDMVVDSYNRMYVAYKDGSTIKVERLLNQGAGLGTASFATISQTTALSSSQIKMVLDEANDDLYVAVQDGTSNNNIIKVHRYVASTGANDGATLTALADASQTLNLASMFIDDVQRLHLAGRSDSGYVWVARVDASGANMVLDTSFATTGLSYAPGTLTVVGGVSIHPDRRVVVVGYNGSNGSMIRFLGDQYATKVSEAIAISTIGQLDTSFDVNDGGVVLSGATGETISAMALGASKEFLCALTTGGNVRIGKYNADMQIVTGFGSSGFTSAVALATVNDIGLDTQGRILVAGQDASADKVLRFAANGNSVEIFATDPTLNFVSAVKEQKAGRVLVSGYDNVASKGAIYAYQSNGTSLDNTFGPVGTSGKYVGAQSTIDDFVILDTDEIIAVQRGTTNFELIKLKADGSALVWGPVDTGIALHVSYAGKVAVNANGDVLVAASQNNGDIGFRLFNSSGTAVAAAQAAGMAGQLPSVKFVAGTNDDKFVIGAYEQGGAINMLLLKVTSAGILDTAFDSDGIAGGKPDSMNQIHDGLVLDDGRVVLGGANTSGAVAVRFHNTPYVTQVAAMPGEAVTGTLDTTIDASGSMTFADHGYIKRVYEYGDGTMLLAIDNGTDSRLVRLRKDLSLDTTFDTDGVVVISSLADVTGLHVDESNNIYVTGGSSTTWTKAYDNSGSALSFAVTANLDAGATEIVEQTLQRVLIAGKHGSSGVIRAYDYAGNLDTTFATTGTYQTGVNATIADVSIDAADKIVLVYANGGSSVLKRLATHGDNEDSTFTAGTAVAVTGDNLKVVHDNDGKIIVASVNGTTVRLRRYDTDGSDDSSEITATLSSTGTIGNLYVTEDGKAVLVGYTANDDAFVIRVASDFTALDTTFNPAGSIPGLFEAAAGTMDRVYDATIHADNRIMLVGGVGVESRIARLFGDAYETVVKQAPSQGEIGALDVTLGTSGVLDVGALANMPTVSIPRVIRAYADGSVVIAVEDSSNSDTTLVKVDCDGVLDASFDSNGVLTLTGLDAVGSMQFDQAGKLLVAGSDGTTAWARRLNESTGAVVDSFVGAAMKTTAGIVEQTNGRVLVAGSNSSDKGLVAAWNPDGSALDTTFGLDAYFDDATNLDGIINSVAVDSKDRIYVSYRRVNNNAAVARIAASGGRLDADIDGYTGFGANGFVADALGESVAGNVKVGLLSDDKVVIAAVNAAQTAYKVAVYGTDGSISTAVTSHNSGSIGLVLRDLIVTSDDKVVLVGDTSTARVVTQMSSTLVADASFATAGIATLTPAGVTALHAAAVTDAGRIVIAGQNATPDPQLIRVYADRYVGQDNQIPSTASVGAFDVSLDVDGGLLLTDRVAGTELNGMAAKAVYTYANGNMLLAVGNSSESKLVRLDVDGFVDTTFGTSGYSATLPGGASVMTFDHAGKILVAGESATGAWVARVNADGTGTPKEFDEFTGVSNVSSVGEQTSGRVLVAGYKSSGSNGVVVGYCSDEGSAEDGTIDKTFGTVGQDGIYLTGVDTRVDGLVVNDNDTFTISFKNGSNKFDVRRINADGSDVDALHTTTEITNGSYSVTVGSKMIKDSSQDVVCAAKTAGGQLTIAKRPYAGGAGAFTTDMSVSGITAVTSISQTASGKFVVTGQAGSNLFVARFSSAGVADATFGTSGLFTGSAETFNQLRHGAIADDGKIVLVGNNGSQNPVMHRVTGDRYDADIRQAQFPVVANPGVIDTTIGTAGVQEMNAELTAGTMKTITLLTDATNENKMIVTVDTGSDTYLARLNKDRTADSGFTNGLIGSDGVTSVAIDHDNKIVIVGDDAGTSWLQRRSQDGSSDVAEVTLTNLANATKVVEQASGRLLVAGQTAPNGTPQILALDIDGNVGDVSFGNGTGKYEVSGQAIRISDMVVDANDRILVAYRDSSNRAAVAAVRPNGSGLDASFGSSGVIAVGNLITGLLTADDEVKLALDSNNKIVVAASTSSGVSVIRYNAAGTAVDSAQLNQALGGNAHVTSLHVTDDDKIVVTAYSETANETAILRLYDNSGSLAHDVAFNSGAAIVTDLSSRNLTRVQDAITYQDRRIIVAGGHTVGTSARLARVYGDEYKDMIDASSTKGELGTADISMNLGNSALNLTTAVTAVTSAMVGVQLKVRASDSAIFMALKDGSNSYLAPLNGDGYLGSHFGGSVVTVADSKADIAAIEFDQSGKLLVVGQDSSNEVWAKRYTTAGVEDTAFTNAANFNSPVGIVEQSCGRVIAAGQDNAGTGGLIVAWKPDGTVDSSFGGGDSVFSDASVTAVQGMDVDPKDRIVLGFVTGADKAGVARVHASGFGLDIAFNSTGLITDAVGSDATMVKVVVDSSNKVVVAAQTASGLMVHRFNEDGTADSNFNGGSGVYTVANSIGVNLSDLMISDAGYIVITGDNGTDSLYVVELDDNGVRASFNSGGILQIQASSNDTMKHAALYSDGRTLLLADNGTDAHLVRVFTDRYQDEYSSLPAQGTDATFDTTFDPNDGTPDGGLNMNSLLGVGSLKSIALRSGTSTIYVAHDSGSASKVARLDYDGNLDTSYASSGVTTTVATGAEALVLDSSNRVIMTGANGGSAWVSRFTESGSLDTTFATASGVTKGLAVNEQTNGRVIVAGSNASGGALAGFTSNGSVDVTFASSGIYTHAAATDLYAMVVDDQDRIVIGYVESGNAKVARVRSEGDSLDSRFGTNGVVTAFAGEDDQNIKLALDSSGNIIVASLFDDLGTMKVNVRRFDNAGVADAAFNSNAVLTVAPGLTTPVLTGIVVTAGGQIFVCGYDAEVGSEEAFFIRINQDGTLDQTFTGQAASMTAAYHGALLPDGRVVFVGEDGTDPVMARVYSERYLSAYRQAPVAGIVGTLDGAIDLDDDLARADRFELENLDASLAAVQPKRLLVDADGSMVLAVQKDATTTSLIRLDADGQLDTTFNSGGAVAGVLDIASAEGVNGLGFDSLDRIVVAGTDGTDSWVGRYNKSTGAAVGTFVQAPSMTEIVNILEQTTGRMILGGTNNSSAGLLIGYAPISYVSGSATNAAILDITFASASRFTHADVKEINSFVIDTKDRVVTAYVNGSGHVELARVRANGCGLDTDFSVDGKIPDVISNAAAGRPAQVALDATGRVIVASATTAGISVRRYDDTGTTEDVGYDITLASAGMTAPVVSRVLTTADHKIVVLGYDNAADDRMFALRLDANGNLDTTFNPLGTVPGLLSYEVDAAQSVRELADAYMHPDGRITTIGHEGALS